MSELGMNETDAIHRRIAEANESPSKRKSVTPENSPLPKKPRPASPLREVKENGHSDQPVTKNEPDNEEDRSAVKIEHTNGNDNAENTRKDSVSSTETKNVSSPETKTASSRRKSQSPTKFTFVPKSQKSPEEKPEQRIDSPDSVRKSNRTPKKSQRLLENEESAGFFGQADTTGSPVKSGEENGKDPSEQKKFVRGRPKGSKNKKPRPDIGKKRETRRSGPVTDSDIDPRFGGKVIIQAKPKTEKPSDGKGPKIKVSGPFTSPKSIKFLDQEEEVKERKAPKASKEQPRLYRANAVLTEDVKEVDESWTCIFCHKHSHEKGLGDLFGPYYVTLPDEPDEEFLTTTRRRATSESRTEPDELEVWFHESCLYWAPNIYMLAGKIIGLEVIIGELRNSECNHCHSDGATIACYHRGCENRSHFPCASGRWQLVEDNYRCYCPTHHI